MATRVVSHQSAPKKRPPINGWKWAFIVLAAIIIGSGLFIGTKMAAPLDPAVKTEKTIKGQPTFSIKLDKQQINGITAYYLNHYLKNSEIKYNVKLENQAVLSGKFRFLSYPTQFRMYLDPYVLQNGDVQFKARQLSIGQLNLPISFVLQYVDKFYHLPKWVKIDSKQKTIVLELNEFKLKNGMQVKAKKIDLIHDEIDLDVYAPLK
ncbi:extracellular protein precursor [Lactobacillus selangorensis]|uniref:Extracellular protein n=1 Tax=Lactobacillus selangorensis TaxID=81857 RepID=A0A0R2FZS7_9LACO|nr:YpmS family protein [Lactobacillus selangorensis]KRN29453.1 extracellular protein precursor [Lactobacillus selangorensis]KRN34018.1 extracellular protein precursor [Lactobacillus selangorensis]